ncbi:hypothetical protein HRbin02_01171 [Candidatus Calditenuaceae archaeon HR02]|nr:hypothetical protein HRbin02_01171 [Candidatus Calditenuaceae archaeon HR02]
MIADVRTRLRVRGFWSQATSRVSDDIEPARRIGESVKKDFRKRQNISRSERAELKAGLLRSIQAHRRLLLRIRSGMKEVD